MKCTQCGYEREENFPHCPQCGAPQETDLISPNPAAQKVLQVLKDPWFLIICILVSANCILSLSADGLPIISILMSVFLWLVYAQSRKDVADHTQLRNVSGTVYAQYVLTYVAAGLVLLAGVICMAAFNVLYADPYYINELLGEFIELDDNVYALFNMAGVLSGSILMVIFAFAAIVVVVFNIFSLRYIHQFAKSVYQSIDTGVLELKYANAASIWLYVFGAISGVGALPILSGEFASGLASGANCAACILAGLLIRRHFLEEA